MWMSSVLWLFNFGKQWQTVVGPKFSIPFTRFFYLFIIFFYNFSSHFYILFIYLSVESFQLIAFLCNIHLLCLFLIFCSLILFWKKDENSLKFKFNCLNKNTWKIVNNRIENKRDNCSHNAVHLNQFNK